MTTPTADLDDAPARTTIGLAPGVPREAAGQDAAKYGSTNPVVRRLLDRWTARLHGVVGPLSGTVVDVGVGEGLCLDRLKAAVARRLPAVAVAVGDAGMLPFPDRAADLVLCIEVLEHLPTVAPAVAELARITRGRCVVSVPWEPWFRLGNLGRGKNVRRLGNDPEHLHAFTPARLRRTLERSFDQVRVVRAFPWLVAEGQPRR
jgi:SAM-dependent methyltransferase